MVCSGAGDPPAARSALGALGLIPGPLAWPCGRTPRTQKTFSKPDVSGASVLTFFSRVRGSNDHERPAFSRCQKPVDEPSYGLRAVISGMLGWSSGREKPGVSSSEPRKREDGTGYHFKAVKPARAWAMLLRSRQTISPHASARSSASHVSIIAVHGAVTMAAPLRVCLTQCRLTRGDGASRSIRRTLAFDTPASAATAVCLLLIAQRTWISCRVMAPHVPVVGLPGNAELPFAGHAQCARRPRKAMEALLRSTSARRNAPVYRCWVLRHPGAIEPTKRL